MKPAGLDSALSIATSPTSICSGDSTYTDEDIVVRLWLRFTASTVPLTGFVCAAAVLEVPKSMPMVQFVPDM
jgi:hypothetical protein